MSEPNIVRKVHPNSMQEMGVLNGVNDNAGQYTPNHNSEELKKLQLPGAIEAEFQVEPATQQVASLIPHKSSEELAEIKRQFIECVKSAEAAPKKDHSRLKAFQRLEEYFSGSGVNLSGYGVKSKFMEECRQESGVGEQALYHYFRAAGLAVKRKIKITKENLPGLKAASMGAEEIHLPVYEESERRAAPEIPTPKIVNEVLKEWRQDKHGLVGAKVSLVKKYKTKSSIVKKVQNAEFLSDIEANDIEKVRELTKKHLGEFITEMRLFMNSDEFNNLPE